jgi:PAS domain S-box-containing protein
MAKKPTYEELEQRVKKLTDELLERDQLKNEVERIFNFSMDMIGSGNLKGYFTKINSSFGKILGYSKKEILEKPFIKFVHDDDVEKTNQALTDARKGKKEIYIENRYKCKDGSYKWIEWKVLVIAKEKKFIAVGRDVTKRKHAEQSLVKAEHEKNSILDSLFEHVTYMDLKMRILWANTAACKSLNLTRDEVIGRHCFKLWAGGSKPCSDCAVVKAMKTGRVQEVQKTTPDGRSWFNIGCPVIDEKNTIIGGIEVVLEITERKQAEEALRDSEERYKTIFETVPTSIVFINKEGDIVDINPYHLNHIGKGKTTKESYTGKNIITHPSIVQAGLSNTYKRLLEGEVFEKTDVYFPTLTGGGDGYFNVRGAPLIKDNEIIGGITTHEDITERKRSVNALRDSEGKLNAMLQSIGDHMSMMDKDLNIIWANKTAKEIFGNDIIGKKCYEVYHHRKKPCEPYPCITLKAFEDGKVHKHDTQVVDRNGKTISFHCTANVALRNKQGYPTAVLEISKDTSEHTQAKLALIKRGKELEDKTHELTEVNAALKVLLKQRDEDQQEFEEKIVANVKKLVLPYIEKLNNSRLNGRQAVYLDIIKSNLEDIIAPFLHQLSSKYFNLTPKEVQIAGLIKDGKTTKEIAKLLNNSTGTIDFHRNNLRKKLGLRNTKKNLRSFLSSLS